MMRQGVLFLRGVLAPETCRSLRALYEQFQPVGTGTDYNGNRVVFIGDMDRNGWLALGILADRARRYVREWYREEHLIEGVFLSRLNPGNIAEPHYDNVKPDGVTPNHTPHRSHSSLFYLNDDFEGGEIEFPRQGLSFKPGAGDFIAFPSGAPYLHRVTPVERGRRYSAPVWFTRDKRLSIGRFELEKEVLSGQ